jgi:hypothetical protein
MADQAYTVCAVEQIRLVVDQQIALAVHAARLP